MRKTPRELQTVKHLLHCMRSLRVPSRSFDHKILRRRRASNQLQHPVPNMLREMPQVHRCRRVTRWWKGQRASTTPFSRTATRCGPPIKHISSALQLLDGWAWVGAPCVRNALHLIPSLQLVHRCYPRPLPPTILQRRFPDWPHKPCSGRFGPTGPGRCRVAGQ